MHKTVKAFLCFAFLFLMSRNLFAYTGTNPEIRILPHNPPVVPDVTIDPKADSVHSDTEGWCEPLYGCTMEDDYTKFKVGDSSLKLTPAVESLKLGIVIHKTYSADHNGQFGFWVWVPHDYVILGPEHAWKAVFTVEYTDAGSATHVLQKDFCSNMTGNWQNTTWYAIQGVPIDVKEVRVTIDSNGSTLPMWIDGFNGYSIEPTLTDTVGLLYLPTGLYAVINNPTQGVDRYKVVVSNPVTKGEDVLLERDYEGSTKEINILKGSPLLSQKNFGWNETITIGIKVYDLSENLVQTKLVYKTQIKPTSWWW